jgi:hypothetical protein
MQSEARGLECDVGLLIDGLGGFDADAGFRDVEDTAARDAVYSLAVLPGDLNGIRFGGTGVAAEITLLTHRSLVYHPAGKRGKLGAVIS